MSNGPTRQTEQKVKEKFGAAKHLDLLALMRARAKESIKYNAGKLVDIPF